MAIYVQRCGVGMNNTLSREGKCKSKQADLTRDNTFIPSVLLYFFPFAYLVEDPYFSIVGGLWYTMCIVMEQHSLILWRERERGGRRRREYEKQRKCVYISFLPLLTLYVTNGH